jgi:hypothetical protein
VLGRLFEPKREEVAGYWRRRRHNEELNNLYASNIIRVIKSKMRWAGHVACMGEMRNVYKKFWPVNLKRRGHAEDLGADGRII